MSTFDRIDDDDNKKKKQKNEEVSMLVQAKMDAEVALMSMAFRYEKRIERLDFDLHECIETVQRQRDDLLKWSTKYTRLENEMNALAMQLEQMKLSQKMELPQKVRCLSLSLCDSVIFSRTEKTLAISIREWHAVQDDESWWRHSLKCTYYFGEPFVHSMIVFIVLYFNLKTNVETVVVFDDLKE